MDVPLVGNFLIVGTVFGICVCCISVELHRDLTFKILAFFIVFQKSNYISTNLIDLNFSLFSRKFQPYESTSWNFYLSKIES